ncbi:MAG: hypothetical protein H0V89_11840 [Deltaproteobacteria bacterium]|nr:hypothetical protein [Deltaproteobacteria bacterium]
MLLLALACARPPDPLVAMPSGLPDRVPGRVLAAQLSPGSVAVHGVTEGEIWVDLDDPEDDRYGFQYAIEDGDGNTLYERSLVGPMVVQSFLEYWSEDSGFDILGALPNLGRFPLPIPLIEGGEILRLRVRSEDGVYLDQGSFALSLLDDPAFELPPSDAVVGFQLIRGTGTRSENQLDLVIVGDGFLAEELPGFAAAASDIAEAFVTQQPWASYRDQINVWRVDAVSANSGVAYDCLERCGPLDTAFDSIYALEVVNAFMGTTYDTRAIFQSDQWAVAQAAAVVPWDAVLVVANTERFGGMAIHYATTTLFPDYTEISTHELGHSIGFLGDEYTGDFCVRSDALGLPDNITDDAGNPPWSHWVDDDVPLPTPDEDGWADRVGAFGPAYNCDELYRPRQHCHMNDYGDFCEVCSELVTRRLHRFVDPADEIQLFPEGEGWQVLAVGDPQPLVVRVDGAVIAEGTVGTMLDFDRPALEGESGELTVEIQGESRFVRDDRGDMKQIGRWTLTPADE